MDVQSDNALSQAYSLIESGHPGEAESLLREMLTWDLENEEIPFVIECCSYWSDIFQKIQTLSPFEQGETLVSQWDQFVEAKFPDDEMPFDRPFYSFKKEIFTYALEQYTAICDEKDNRLHAEIYRKMGLCHKRLGSYEQALSCLAEANNTLQGQAAVLAEMADCYDLCGETKLAKVLFKEAFYIDAGKINLAQLCSPLIEGLVAKVEEEGYSGEELQEWIPVFGILLGVFNVKRTMRSQEIMKLKLDIAARENELKDPSNRGEVLRPRLMNMYLWLMDYYLISHESMTKINEVLLKIKLLDPEIYKRFFSFNSGPLTQKTKG